MASLFTLFCRRHVEMKGEWGAAVGGEDESSQGLDGVWSCSGVVGRDGSTGAKTACKIRNQQRMMEDQDNGGGGGGGVGGDQNDSTNQKKACQILNLII